jgi:hypothetical protein
VCKVSGRTSWESWPPGWEEESEQRQETNVSIEITLSKELMLSAHVQHDIAVTLIITSE